uniref:Uncharacterized protein n=2 Tax=Colobinae TaxID=9569 RepID=A0A2K5HAQ0_COLAP
MREPRLREMPPCGRGGSRALDSHVWPLQPSLPKVSPLSLAFLLHLLRHFRSTSSSTPLTTSSQSILLLLFGK